MRREIKLLNYFILICVVLLNSGCAGMMMRSAMIGNTKTYGELSESLSPIPEGKGRLFIYMADGGPSVLNSYGIVGEAITVDNDVQFISGETYFYVDLDIGKHEVTATKVISGQFKMTIRRGDNSTDVMLSDQQVKYVRIDFKGYIGTPRFGTYHPILIESNQHAKTEISNLKFYTDHDHGMFGDKVFKVDATL